MVENQLSTIINNTLQQKSEEFQNHEIFSMISLMALVEIVDLFQEKTFNKTVSTDDNPQSVTGNANLNSLLNQLDLQGNDNSNIEQLLPLLLKLLGNQNNLNQIMNLLNPGPKRQNEKEEVDQESEREKEKEKTENEKTSKKKKES